jgi:pyoverdine/dityrosine biosynthesis protein Dit1
MLIRPFADTLPVTDDLAMSFHDAVRKMAHFIEASHINEKGTTISEFKAQYSNVLNRTDNGSLEVITRSNRRYVILDEDQVLTLVKNAQPQHLAGELLADLHLLSATEARPRAHSVNTPSLGRLPE